MTVSLTAGCVGENVKLAVGDGGSAWPRRWSGVFESFYTTKHKGQETGRGLEALFSTVTGPYTRQYAVGFPFVDGTARDLSDG